jgi:hypothetical protein
VAVISLLVIGSLAMCASAFASPAISVGWPSGYHFHVDTHSGSASGGSLAGSHAALSGVQPALIPAGASGGPLLYNQFNDAAAVVQHAPKLYVIFWGNWSANTPLTGTACGSTTCTAATLKSQFLSFYNGLSGSTYQQILTQYYDNTGYITETPTMASTTGFVDATVPTNVNGTSIANEFSALATQNGWNLQGSVNNQFIMLPAPGTNYEGASSFTATFGAQTTSLTNVSNFTNVAPGQVINGPGLPPNDTIATVSPSTHSLTVSVQTTAQENGATITGQAFDQSFSGCGGHGGLDGSNFVTTFIPYPGDQGSGAQFTNCGLPPYNNDEVQAASHEYAEAATDPEVDAIWASANDAGEIGDVCVTGDPSTQDKQLSFGFVQLLWDNNQNTCSYQDTGQWGAFPPRVTGVSPNSGPLGGGTTVTVTGANFVAGTTSVRFGGIAGSNVSVLNPDTLTVQSPSGPSGTVDVTAVTNLGTSATSSADQFTYPPAGVSTTSTFQFPAGAPATTDLHAPWFTTTLTPATTWTEKALLTNGTSDVATSTLSVITSTQNSNGSFNANLTWHIQASGAVATPITNRVLCTTNSAGATCTTSITVNSGDDDQLLLSVVGNGSNNNDLVWNGALNTGTGQVNVGTIDVPGGPTTVDESQPITETVSAAPGTACSAIPASDVTWISPRVAQSVGNRLGYATYVSSAVGAGSCNAQFNPFTSGPQSGVEVIAPH